MTPPTTPPLVIDDLADVRAGDKGDTLILAVIARTPAGFETLRERLLPAAVAHHFGCRGEVARTVLPQLLSLVFRVPDVLSGGVTGYAGLDGHGKTLSYHLLGLRLDEAPSGIAG